MKPSSLKQIKEWRSKFIRFYQDLGWLDEFEYLGAYARTPDAGLDSLIAEDVHPPIHPSGKPFETGELSLLSAAGCAWWKDMEADIDPGCGYYARAFAEWAGISRGAFQPRDIIETYEDERDGPVWITFVLNDVQHRFRPWCGKDFSWIDLNLFNEINKLIETTGFQFYVYEWFDQTAFVIVLSTTEKRKLEQERHWRFVRIPGDGSGYMDVFGPAICPHPRRYE